MATNKFSSESHVWAIVMAGGQGTRLWPASRKKNPKQFLKLFGTKTLIENTVDRISTVIPKNRIFIITDQAQVARTKKLFPKIPASQIIGEPCGRNTAATIGLGAFLARKKDRDAVIAIFPSDHVILDRKKFKTAVLRAAHWAKKGANHVVFGVKPTYPATAYGYIQRETKQTVNQIYKLKRFVEKPNLKKAQGFIRNNQFYWQAGIFIFHVNTILSSLKRFLPTHYRNLNQISGAWKGQKFPLPNLFSSLPSISIDYGVMEKLKTTFMVPAHFDWNDIGSWNALESVWPKDSHGNSSFGPHVAHAAAHNIAYSPRLVCFSGVRDLIVIDSGDALLVTSKKEAEKVKELVQLLAKKKLNRYL